jgi:hypothetical protein
MASRLAFGRRARTTVAVAAAEAIGAVRVFHERPVLRDLQQYPHILKYFEQNYVPLDRQWRAAAGRQPAAASGRFGALGFPCFR